LCSDSENCSFCFGCKNAKGLKYAINNIELAKEEYDEKIKELKKSPNYPSIKMNE